MITSLIFIIIILLYIIVRLIKSYKCDKIYIKDLHEDLSHWYDAHNRLHSKLTQARAYNKIIEK